MTLPEKKNLAERLEDAEGSIKDAIEWLRDGGHLDVDTEGLANDAIQTIIKLRRACD
jgi:hypothetical protein